ncbi:uncharacterized protein LOC142993136 isoform X2 [Genypterus blacodes]|uniref:uncharacterized protein LOC142993136 isoform X2 n=1 Tax=Genypterus blacodes TaxID=154954 RepID=UPI003F75E92D
MAVWQEETEEQLVCMVQERPALYDITENVYANKVLKTHLWREISDRLRVSEKELKKRWQSLRTQYIRYRKAAILGSCGAVRTGRQQWILSRLQFLDPHTKRKEGWTDLSTRETSSDFDSPSDGTNYIKIEVQPSPPNSDTPWEPPSEESCVPEPEPRPCSPLEETTATVGAEEAPSPLREELWPCTSSESSASRPLAKRRRTQLEEPVPNESTNLMRIICSTLERIVSHVEQTDDISRYCRNLESRMRKLPAHLQPHFQHEVDTLIYRYLTGTDGHGSESGM